MGYDCFKQPNREVRLSTITPHYKADVAFEPLLWPSLVAGPGPSILGRKRVTAFEAQHGPSTTSWEKRPLVMASSAPFYSGKHLEKHYGSRIFIAMISLFTPLCGIMYLLIAKVAADTMDVTYITTCTSGFSCKLELNMASAASPSCDDTC